MGSLIGLRVQLKIMEDGTPNPPKLPLGRIVRSIVGPDGVTYYQVLLDHSVSCIDARTGKEWMLLNLMFIPHILGVSFEELPSAPRKSFIHIRIANVLSPIDPNHPAIDFSKLVHFGLGVIEIV